MAKVENQNVVLDNDYAIKSWRNVEIMQYCSFGFTMEKIPELVNDWSCVNSYAYICHDEENDEGTEPHIHLMLSFNCPVQTKNILSRFGSLGIKFEHLSKIKSGRFSSAVAYLTHENKPEKHKYDRSKVISKGLDLDKTIDGELSLMVRPWYEIMALIENYDIYEYNKYTKLSTMELIKYDKQLKIALNKQLYTRRESIQKGKFNMRVIWLYGNGGTGKTLYAKQIAKEHYGDNYYITSGSNDLFDGYNGESCIIVDDLKESAMKLQDWLHLFDNNTRTSIKSRYINKFLFCECIIVTCTVNPMQFWFSCCDRQDFNKDIERKNVHQFLRRIPMVCQLTYNTIQYAMYNDDLREYSISSIMPNNIISQFKIDNENRQNDYSDFLGIDNDFSTETYSKLAYSGV